MDYLAKMGLDKQLFNFLPSFLGDVLTLGRLTTMMKGYEEFYADGIILSNGAKSISSIDYSDFEGATILHDMNEYINSKYHEKFDTIIDAGTLEHIFNLPTALSNCMKMLRKDGILIINCPTNNWCGHGFYQFSPELFFSALNRSNGFEIERVVVHRLGSSKMYKVLNPLETGFRTELISIFPYTLKILARRIEIKEPFEQWPQQSDYVKAWNCRVSKLASRPFYQPILDVLNFSRMSIRNRRYFEPID